MTNRESIAVVGLVAAMLLGCSGGGGQGWDPQGGGGEGSTPSGGGVGSTASGGGGQGNAPGGGAPSPGSIPAALVNSWYAGQGYTSVPYSPSTGTWGTPSGKGLIYIFEADGSYQKAFQSYESSGGCTTGFTAFESGTAIVNGDQLALSPDSGRLKYTASCAPSLDSDDPLVDLADEYFTWSLGVSEYDAKVPTLYLEAPEGASATFLPL